jgi:hypothetical protein
VLVLHVIGVRRIGDFGGASYSIARLVLHVVGESTIAAVLVDDLSIDLLVTVFADYVDSISRVSCSVVLLVLYIEVVSVIVARVDVVGTGLVVVVLADCVDGISRVSCLVLLMSHVEALSAIVAVELLVTVVAVLVNVSLVVRFGLLTDFYAFVVLATTICLEVLGKAAFLDLVLTIVEVVRRSCVVGD